MPFNDTPGFVLTAAACALVLALCGGGGSTSTTPPPGRSMAQLDSEPVALPEGVTLATAGTFTVEPGRSVDRDGVRFSCAAGGAACAVTVDGGSGTARVTGGRLTVARVADPGGTGGLSPERAWLGGSLPDWPTGDVSATRSRMGGSVLSWSSDDIRNRGIGRAEGGIRLPHGSAPATTVSVPGALSTGGADGGSAIGCGESASMCETEAQPVMTYRGVHILQARTRVRVGRRSNNEKALRDGYIYGKGAALVAYVDDSDSGSRSFKVERWRDGVGSDDESEGFWGEYGSFPRHSDYDRSLASANGLWQGALVGVGISPTSPLYRQFIIGDVDLTVQTNPDQFDPDDGEVISNITFSNIRNINTGESVTLSSMRWRYTNTYINLDIYGGGRTRDSDGDPVLILVRDEDKGHLAYRFASPDRSTVLGVFHTGEAIGSFGAKKQ